MESSRLSVGVSAGARSSPECSVKAKPKLSSRGMTESECQAQACHERPQADTTTREPADGTERMGWRSHLATV